MNQQKMPAQDYPDWLAHSLLNAELRWDKAQHANLPRFLEKYNLHDSTWYGLFTKPNNSTVAMIEWDSVHCVALYPELFAGSIWNQSPILLIDFSTPPYQILLDSNLWEANYRPIIGLAWSNAVPINEREEMLSLSFRQNILDDRLREAYLDTELTHTVFEQISGGNIHLLHSASVRLLCMDWAGNILTIPSWD